MNEEIEQPTPQFPLYTPPATTGIPLADSKQSAVLGKRIMKMMPKMKAPRRGIQSDQQVHVKHGKSKKHPNPVQYY